MTTPRLRFPEFINAPEWEVKKLKDNACVTAGQSPDGNFYNDFGNGLPFYQGKTDFGDLFLQDPQKWTTKITKVAQKDDILMSVRAPVGALNISKEKICIGRGLASIRAIIDRWFLYYSLLSISKKIVGNGGSIFDSISKPDIEKIIIFTPSLPEQQKIADCLTSLDDLITAQNQKITALKNHKTALIQQLFPAEGQTTPRLRFPEFQNAPEWEEKKIKDILDYERPDPYIVLNTAYVSSGTPVLTANKSFILGSTDENFGIYENTPVVIFDDFTTDSKYVDFPFKVKSSAIKILTSDSGNNLKFLYELMKLIQFTGTEHKRYYISEYQMLFVSIPSIPEQQKIADCLTSLDDLISTQNQKLTALKNHKTALMQQLFPVAEAS